MNKKLVRISVCGGILLALATIHLTSKATDGLIAQTTLNIDESKIVAHTAIVKDVTHNQVLYEKNADEVLPLASLTKLVTALSVKELQKNWANMPSTIKLISNGQPQNIADKTLRVGGYMKIQDILSYMLLTSSNYAAHSLSYNLIPYHSFISYMNFTAKKYGATHMYFVNATGLTEELRNKVHINSVGSAKDVIAIMSSVYTLYPELAAPTRTEQAYIVKQSTGEKIVVENTNPYLDQIPNIVLGKTGYTEDAGGNLAVLIQKNNTLYGIVVMNSTKEARFTDLIYLASQI